MSQPVRAVAGGPVQANLFGIKLISVSVMLMLVGVRNFGQVQKVKFVIVKIFCSNSNQFLVILNRSSELAPVNFLL